MRIPFLPAVAILLLSSSVSNAHTHVEKTKPANNSTVKTSPKEIVLHFSDDARLTSLTIKKQGETEQAVMASTAVPTKTVKVPISTLTPGHYVVTYRFMGDDNQETLGTLRFTVGAP